MSQILGGLFSEARVPGTAALLKPGQGGMGCLLGVGARVWVVLSWVSSGMSLPLLPLTASFESSQ